MKERPIIMGGESVRGIIEGRKTQTRRLVTSRNPIGFIGGRGEESDPAKWGYFFDRPEQHGWAVLARGHDDRQDHGCVSIPCPYGVPGDRLWVKETWYCDDFTAGDFDRARVGYSSAPPSDAKIIEQWREALDYRADHDCNVYEAGCPCRNEDGKSEWRTPLFMSRWASRLTLDVVEVRVQRLQDITEEDARAEGVERDTSPCDHTRRSCEEIGCMGHAYTSGYCDAWDRINGKRAPWTTNPWVWAITFKRGEEARAA